MWLVESSNEPALSAEIVVYLLSASPAKIWENWTDAQWIRTLNVHDDCLTFNKFNVVPGSPHTGENCSISATVLDSAHSPLSFIMQFWHLSQPAEMEQDRTPVAPGQTSWTYSINKRADKIWRVSMLEVDRVLNPRFLIRRILMLEDARGLSPFCRLRLVARLSNGRRISMLEAHCIW